MERGRKHLSRSKKKWWWENGKLSLPSPITTPVCFNKRKTCAVRWSSAQASQVIFTGSMSQCRISAVWRGSVYHTKYLCYLYGDKAAGSHLMYRGWLLQNTPDSSWLSLCLLSVYKPLLLSLSTFSDAVGQMWQCGTESQEPKCLGRCEGHGLSRVSSPLQGK